MLSSSRRPAMLLAAMLLLVVLSAGPAMAQATVQHVTTPQEIDPSPNPRPSGPERCVGPGGVAS